MNPRLSRDFRPTWIAPGRPGLYCLKDGEVFELDQEAWETLAALHAGGPCLPQAEELVAAVQDAGALVDASQGWDEFPSLPREEGPYLRYLNLQITHRCQLRCAHCYHGEALDVGKTLDADLVLGALEDFASLGGLACTITGGEPAMHPDFWDLNARLPGLGVRAELFTNGLGIRPDRVGELNCHRLRLSLDGLEAGHERVRGKGTFAPAMRFARAVQQAGIDLVISTEIHRQNLGELDALEELVRDELGSSSWRVGVPFLRGYWNDSREQLEVAASEAGKLRSRYGYGRRGFVSESLSGCDAEMLTIDADGSVGSCAMLGDSFRWSLVEDRLDSIWKRRVAALGDVDFQSLACRARADDQETSRMPIQDPDQSWALEV